VRTFILIYINLFLYSCAGPMTPFGAKNVFLKNRKIEPIKVELPQARNLAQLNEINNDKVKITFSPKKQNWHDAKEVTIKIHDPSGVPISHKINVFYNDENINSTLANILDIRIDESSKNIILKLDKIRLLTRDEHKIVVTYRRSLYEPLFQAYYESPDCPLYDIQQVVNTAPFKIKRTFLENVHDISSQSGYNPSLLTALIAQESGFSTKAVSWAKAIGLTQITSLAEQEIIDKHPDWPRYNNSKGLNFIEIKALIATGKMNKKNEWRLDKYKSVQGGIDYLNYLDKYWNTKKNLNSLANFDSIDRRDIILASYNSGPARVRRNLNKNGVMWLEQEELSEAKKYVKRIRSYCYHFNTK